MLLISDLGSFKFQSHCTAHKGLPGEVLITDWDQPTGTAIRFGYSTALRTATHHFKLTRCAYSFLIVEFSLLVMFMFSLRLNYFDNTL